MPRLTRLFPMAPLAVLAPVIAFACQPTGGSSPGNDASTPKPGNDGSTPKDAGVDRTHPPSDASIEAAQPDSAGEGESSETGPFGGPMGDAFTSPMTSSSTRRS
jgi:hypothetical protein